MKSRWGYWSGEKREICLSRDLIYSHSWEKIRDVLHHEMAHQLADQLLGERHDESPHGQTFQKACYLLRIDNHTAHDPKQHITEAGVEQTSLEKTMVRRVRKLLALAGSQNAHEAEAAMSKAHKLIAKYNVNILKHDRPRRFTNGFVGKSALRHSRDIYYLANLLQDYYFVDGIWIPAYVLERGKMGRVLEISGTPHNVEMASYVYDYVQHYSRCQWEKYNKSKKLNHYRKTDFLVGIIQGFREKLEYQTAKWGEEKNQWTLIKSKDPQLTAYTAYKYPHTTRFKRNAANQDAKVIEEGVRVGKKMVIHKGITEKRGFNRKLLESKS
jgi:hypothetical protein